MTDTPQYSWQDAAGTTTSLMNPAEYVVLREGVHGFADITDERNLASVSSQTGERYTNTAGKAREFGFEVMIIGSTHADLEAKRAKLLKMFARPGRLFKKTGASTVVHIDCYAARGSPGIQNGTSPDATRQQVSISLVAPDPHFYGDQMTVSLPAGSTTLSVTNTGAADAPCTIVLNADTATNTTSGKSMAALNGQTISGSAVTITDDGVSALIGSTNVLGRFTYDSEFWTLVPGINTLTGVSQVTFSPRWNGV